MEIMKVDGLLYKQIVTNGAASLRANYKIVDALNVFPVPDGDTGTNMRMTIEAGVDAISSCDDTKIGDMAKKLSRGMLMGARGNSGVILSQLFRGIAKGLEGLDEVNAVELGKAFKMGVAQAYKAVMKPTEGTILTVAREASDYAFKKANKKTTILEYFDILIKESRASLDRTPNLLPVLKDAGVVDSGGAGYIYVLEGMQKALKGEMIEAESAASTLGSVKPNHTFTAHSVLEYGYCTEFILQLQHAKVKIATFDENVIKDYLVTMGDSIVCFKDEDIVKVHVHTKTPGDVLNHCQQWGEYITIKIENMSVQHNESEDVQALCDCPECVAIRELQERKKFAVVAVASGDGLVEMFKSMGVDYIVSGGQSMNPAAEDFVKGFDLINAENIIVFPNNSNIVLTAKQAAKYYDKANILVANSKSLAQGYSALTMLDVSSGDPEQIMAEIDEVIGNVTTGLITYSIRDAELDGIQIHKDDFIGICNSKMVSSEKTKEDALKQMLSKTDLSEKEIITLIYGADVTEEEAEAIKDYIESTYTNIEVDVIEGKQEVYSYILSIE